MEKTGIVSGGREELLAHPEVQGRLAVAIREIRARHEAEFASGSVFTRIRAWFRMRKEIKAAEEAHAPSRGCYLSK
jgi:hypothetical protein